MTNLVYTIGHSTHSIRRFIELLDKHSITAVCDVRSKPYSRMNPQFNREAVKEALFAHSITYVFLGKELGARTDDRSCYCNGKVQYELLAKTEEFRKGIDRVTKGMREFRIALMCAEKEPLDCHRTILVSRILAERGVRVRHILEDGKIEEHSHALRRLVGILRIPPPDMFRSEETVIRDAYAKQGQQIAYEIDGVAEASDRDQTRYDPHGSRK